MLNWSHDVKPRILHSLNRKLEKIFQRKMRLAGYHVINAQIYRKRLAGISSQWLGTMSATHPGLAVAVVVWCSNEFSYCFFSILEELRAKSQLHDALAIGDILHIITYRQKSIRKAAARPGDKCNVGDGDLARFFLLRGVVNRSYIIVLDFERPASQTCWVEPISRMLPRILPEMSLS